LFPDQPQVSKAIETSIAENPLRIDDAYAELLEGHRTDPSEILNVAHEVEEGSHRGLVMTTDVPFVSFCAHHFLPFFGSVDVTYRPGRYILGLGKIPRLIRCRSRRFQLQEIMVREIAEDMVAYGEVVGVSVTAKARHLCICYRGPDDAAVLNETSYALGQLRIPG
jgi:GTP cyclohydrolase I